VDDTALLSMETRNSPLKRVVARQEMDKMNDNVEHGNLHEQQSSIVQMQQTLLTSGAVSDLLPLVSCDSASSSLTSEQLQQEEDVSLDIRHGTTTTTITLAEVSKSFDKSRVVGKSSFEDTQNGTIQVHSRKLPLWEPPPKRTTASEDKQDCSLRVHEDKNMEVTFEIPHDCAKYIVGRGGSNLLSIQQETGCKIDIDRVEIPAVGGMRTVTLTAPNLAAIKECRSIIENMISKKRIIDSLPTSTAPTVDVEDSRVFKKIFIPTDHNPGYNYKALIIGPKGKKHQELVASCGGEISIKVRGMGIDGSTDEPLHVILDGTKASVDKAEKLIMELLDTEKARFLDTLANRKRKSLLGTDSLSEHSIEYPRKSCKVMGKTITLTIPLWVMKAGDDLNGKYVTFLILMTIA